MVIYLSQHNRSTNKNTLLASFSLKGERVEAKWEPNAEWFKEDIQNNGVITKAGQFFIKDGKAFIDNLVVAFSNSSTIIVHKKPLKS